MFHRFKATNTVINTSTYDPVCLVPAVRPSHAKKSKLKNKQFGEVKLVEQ